MAIVRLTSLGVPLPHPDNDPYATDVPNIADALTKLSDFVSAIQLGLSYEPGEGQAEADLVVAARAATEAARDAVLAIETDLRTSLDGIDVFALSATASMVGNTAKLIELSWR